MPAIFPRWTNNVPIVIGLIAPLVGGTVLFVIWYWFSPLFTDVGYRPVQPVAYSHKLHAGEIGIDCRYCHNTVERGAAAAVPPAATCMNCHAELVKSTLEGGPYHARLEKVRNSFETGEAIEWVRVHMLPDYAYFNHSAHVGAGVGCASCHGRVDQMIVVEQVKPLSMGWCLDCHRNPEPNLRPLDQVTNMAWDRHEAAYDADKDPKRKREVNPPTHCSGCHR